MRVIPEKKFTIRRKDEEKRLDIVETILDDVKKSGDAAILKYTKKFDGVELKKMRVTKAEIRKAYEKLDKKTLEALKKAGANIEKFAKEQLKSIKEFKYTVSGNTVGQRIIPLSSVGCYVPGGRYPLPSSALMTTIPAKVVGVKRIVVCSPKIAPVTIVAADIGGATEIYRIGGAQAIAAMAFGTKAIAKVDKIVGPGNKYVTAAKKEVYGIVGIDFLAGPSEVLVIADSKANPKIVAADVLAQAEHDPSSVVNVIALGKSIAKEVSKEVMEQLKDLPTRSVAEPAVRKGSIIVAKSRKKAVELANAIAPEHLELQVKAPWKLVQGLKNYGALFIGENTAEVFGDYCSGPNHTLPTGRSARYTGGLSVLDYIKVCTFQSLDKVGVRQLQCIASELARIEGLIGHKKAADMRLQPKS